jgi:hypothetical protein
MTGRSDFTEQEWDLLLQGPPTAGMIVVTSDSGGVFRESLAMGKAYGEARRQHGASQLLDEITSARPKVDRSRSHSPDELRQNGLERLREVAQLLRQKASEQELDDYRSFVLALAERVAAAHREDGVAVSQAERAAIDEVAAALGASGQPLT